MQYCEVLTVKLEATNSVATAFVLAGDDFPTYDCQLHQNSSIEPETLAVLLSLRVEPAAAFEVLVGPFPSIPLTVPGISQTAQAFSNDRSRHSSTQLPKIVPYQL